MRHAPLRHDALSCWYRDKKFKAKNLEKGERFRTSCLGRLELSWSREDGNYVFQGHPVLKVFSTALNSGSSGGRTPYASWASCQGLNDKLRCYVASNCMVEHPKFMEEHFPQHPCSFKATQRAYAYLIFFFALELHQPKSKTYDFIPIDKVLDTKPNFPTLVFWEPWTTTKTTNKMWDDKLRLGKFCIYE